MTHTQDAGHVMRRGGSLEDAIATAESLLEHARVLYAQAQSDDPAGRRDLTPEVDRLLRSAHQHADPIVVGQLLRYATLIRMTDDNAEPAALPLLEEYEAYCKRHGLVALVADTYALHAKRALSSGHEDAAISEIAKSLAILDEYPEGGGVYNQPPWLTVLGTVLVDISVVLMALGVFEVADQIMRRARTVAEQRRDPHLETVLNCNRIFLLLEWGRRLERLGYPDTARQNFIKASSLATQTESVYVNSRFPFTADRPIADQHHGLAVAHAYANPGSQHYARLQERLGVVGTLQDRMEVALALARCMEREGGHSKAVDLLNRVAKQEGRQHLPYPLLRVSLHRELARLTELAERHSRAGAVDDYIHNLELQLWQMRETRMVTLNTRREHERLTRAHGTASAQAMQDPLTELPNRRALNERLATVTSGADNFPLSVALIDLDGFKRVNDEQSHARGDEVLRAVAGALRDALRGDDLVARYGGDEFVAVLAGAPLHAAEAALGRALAAVRALPGSVTYGVTLSVGVVSMGTGESPSSALARADAAMYDAKRRGGDAVALATPAEQDPGGRLGAEGQGSSGAPGGRAAPGSGQSGQDPGGQPRRAGATYDRSS